MIALSTDSLFFAALLVIAPLLLRHNRPFRRYIYLVLNILVFAVSMTSALQAVIAAAWLLVPYFYVKSGSRIDAGKREKWHFNGILISLMLIVFVYLQHYNFVLALVPEKLQTPFRILGLSYFLFREIDFIMQYDYLKEMEIKISLVDYLNYALGFYCILAGPILRYEEFVTDFYAEKEQLTGNEIYRQLNRAVNGYLKVYVISGILAFYAKLWFDGLRSHSGIITTAGAFVVFALLNGWYIYFNFSGYCDIVVAFASLAGLTVHENFNQPYLARSVVEFWNRHHITLSEWIRDYIFSPLFKMLISGPCEKNMKLGQYIALFVTFTMAGVWHGTDMNYLVYGLFQGLGIVVATIWKENRKKLLGKERNKAYEKSTVAIWCGRFVTWMYICCTFAFVGYDLVGMIVA